MQVDRQHVGFRSQQLCRYRANPCSRRLRYCGGPSSCHPGSFSRSRPFLFYVGLPQGLQARHPLTFTDDLGDHCGLVPQAAAHRLLDPPDSTLWVKGLSCQLFTHPHLDIYRVMATRFAAAMSSCVDDVICVERMTTIQSAYRCWRRLCDLLGWDVPDSKSPPP